MKVAAVMTLRDEVNVLPINLAYHRALGIDEFWIVDDGSEDGTVEVLKALSQRHAWINWTSDPGPFRQSEMVTGLAQEAYKHAADWIIAIDADEFWSTSTRPLRDVLDTQQVGALACEVDNFVQSSHVVHDHPASLTTMIYRAEPKGRREDARRLVEEGEIAFVEIAYPPKLVVRSTSSLVIGKGNHAATGFAGGERETTELIVLHAPIRARDRLRNRAEQGRRTAAVHPSPDVGWHLRRVAAIEDTGELKADWVANSHRRGALTVDGQQHALLRDHRLREAVRPFVSRAAGGAAAFVPATAGRAYRGELP